LIAGFVAQAVQCKLDIFDTVVAAVYFAGLAGDIAAEKLGKRVMTASDVAETFSQIFQQFDV
jgi:NAD(P)H-hydrate repair Nnr-like enzyme with NAD(P)H-hydrate dehydratase domain